MGGVRGNTGASGWDSEDDETMEFDDYLDEGEAEIVRLPTEDMHGARAPGKSRPLARRLIEQAWEQQELSRSLADFDDYVV